MRLPWPYARAAKEWRGELEVVVVGLRAECSGWLAGSVLTMDRAVQNVMRYANWSLHDGVRLATANPAQVLGESTLGVLEPGSRADINVLSPDGDVLQSFVGGCATRG